MFYWIVKAVLKLLLNLLYRIRVEGLEYVPKQGGAVVAANHLSFLDSFFIPLVIKGRKVTYLAKAEYFTSWKTAWFFRMVGQIPIERGGGKRSERALQTGLQALADGNLLGIYPEGTRSPDGYMHKARTGVSRLCLEARVPVVPCGVVGTDKVMPKWAKVPRLRGRLEVRIRFGRPLDFTARYGTGKPSVEVLRAVADEVTYEIMELSGQDYKDEYAASAAGKQAPTAGGDDDTDLSEDVLEG